MSMRLIVYAGLVMVLGAPIHAVAAGHDFPNPDHRATEDGHTQILRFVSAVITGDAQAWRQLAQFGADSVAAIREALTRTLTAEQRERLEAALDRLAHSQVVSWGQAKAWIKDGIEKSSTPKEFSEIADAILAKVPFKDMDRIATLAAQIKDSEFKIKNGDPKSEALQFQVKNAQAEISKLYAGAIGSLKAKGYVVAPATSPGAVHFSVEGKRFAWNSDGTAFSLESGYEDRSTSIPINLAKMAEKKGMDPKLSLLPTKESLDQVKTTPLRAILSLDGRLGESQYGLSARVEQDGSPGKYAGQNDRNLFPAVIEYLQTQFPGPTRTDFGSDQADPSVIPTSNASVRWRQERANQKR